MRLQSGTSNNNDVATLALLYETIAAQSDDLTGSMPYFVRIRKVDICGTTKREKAILITAITAPSDSRLSRNDSGVGKLHCNKKATQTFNLAIL
jgi:hypothetical protein